MGWGKEWPVLMFKDMTKEEILQKWPVNESIAEAEKAYADAALQGTGFIKDGKHVPLEQVYNNLKPTHDPYTNPNALIYYECACGAILDPKTKSFAQLNNIASANGWKIRWGHDQYQPYCPKCGEGVE